MMESESILGVTGSPVAGWFTAWSVCLALLLFVFARGLQQAFWPKAKRIALASLFLVVYGIGEGLGSGLFPFDHIGDALTLSGKIHSTLSIVGSGGLYLLPLVWLWKPPAQGPRLRALSWGILLFGGLFMLVFAAAKAGLLGRAGLWQRAYIAVYYIYLLTLARCMYRSSREKHVMPHGT